MREIFEPWDPKPETMKLLQQIIVIVEQYLKMGFKLTLRQLFYQLVSRDIVPNTLRSYKRVGDIVSNGRRGGFLDWNAIEDRIRVPERPPQFDSLDDLVEAAIRSYRLPRLKGQDQYVELWVEKDALAGVLEPIAREHHVTLMVNRGYSSTSAMKEAGERLRHGCRENGCKEAVVLYIGDFDPSGEDMVRDVEDRLREYTNSGWGVKKKDPLFGGITIESEEEAAARRGPRIHISVEKLALTMDQIEEHNPPPNPAKITDSRAAKYIAEHGDESWEVDALPPVSLRDVIEGRLTQLIDLDLVEPILEQEEVDKARLRSVTRGFDKDPEPKEPEAPAKPSKSKKRKR